MNNDEFQKTVVHAAKWSALTELAAKLISPFVNMVLARILVPEAFGIVATITMIISFADMFTDSGFQKYLIQHEFIDDSEKENSANVAFWTNMLLSILLLGLIIFFRNEIANLVGNQGLGNVLAIACLQLPLTAFSSIQMALYRRAFNFKTLFFVRIISILIPLFVTLPLAFMGWGYWALIVGSLVVQMSNAFILTIKSEWKPKLYFDVYLLKKMLSFSIWSLVEAIAIWLTTWADSFVIGTLLNQYYLGLYKTSTTMVNTLMALITSASTPIIFSSLSRLQNETEMFNNFFLRFQRLVSVFVFPIGVGVFLFSDLATQILLGNQWGQASNIIGIWALTSSITIVFSHFCSEVYRSKGRPRLSFFTQIVHLFFLIPTCIIAAKYGFWPLVYARALIRFQGVLVHLLVMKFIIKFPVHKMFVNLFPTIFSTFVMGTTGYLLKSISDGIVWDLLNIAICIIIYFSVLILFSSMRKELKGIIVKLLPNSVSRKIN